VATTALTGLGLGILLGLLVVDTRTGELTVVWNDGIKPKDEPGDPCAIELIDRVLLALPMGEDPIVQRAEPLREPVVRDPAIEWGGEPVPVRLP
jgi:hypothetical protein